MAATVVQTPTRVNLSGVSSSTFSISFASTPTASNAIVMVGSLIRQTTAPTISSVTDNQTGNSYSTHSASTTVGFGGYLGTVFTGYDTAVNSSGTFTLTVTCSTSASTDGSLGAYEVDGLSNTTVNASGTVGGFDCTTNDTTVSTSAATTVANCWVVGVMGLNSNGAACAINGASGYTNHYDCDGSGSTFGFSSDSKSVTSTGTQTILWSHDNSSYWDSAAIILAFAEVSYQYAYPTTDTTRDNWEEDDGTTTNIYDQIDEATADDADYIRTQTAPSSDVYVTKLGTVTDPSSSTGHTVSVRYGKDSTGGDTISLVAQLRQGYTNESSQGTLIATALNNSNISSGWTTAAYTLTSGEADSITDYSNLYLRLVGNQEAVGYSATPPSHRNTSNFAQSTTSVNINNATNSEGDVAIMVVESSDSTTAAGTPNTPSNWTKIFEDTEGSGASGVTTLTVFARIVPAGGLSGTYTTVDGVGDHVGGAMTCISGHGLSSVSDIVVGTASKHGTTQTGCSTSGITVTANSMVVLCIAFSDDAADTSNATSYSNSNLASITEREDETNLTGAGGGVAITTATCAGTTTGATTWNHDTAANSLSVMLGIRPALAPRRAQVSWARFRTPEASNPTYNDSITFSTTLSHAQTPVASALPSRTETATLAHAQVPLAAGAASRTESVTLTQAQLETLLFSESLTQSVVMAQAQVIAAAANVARAETLTLAQAQSGVAAGQAVRAENVTLTHGISPAAQAQGARTEVVTLAQGQVPSLLFGASVSFDLGLVQTQVSNLSSSESVGFNVNLVQTPAAQASAVGIVTFPAGLAQAHSGIVTALPSLTFPVSLSQAEAYALVAGATITFSVTLDMAQYTIQPYTESVSFAATFVQTAAALANADTTIPFAVGVGTHAVALVSSGAAAAFPVVATFSPVPEAQSSQSVTFTLTLTHSLAYQRINNASISYNVTFGHVIVPLVAATASTDFPVLLGQAPVLRQDVVEALTLSTQVGMEVSYPWMPEREAVVTWTKEADSGGVWTKETKASVTWSGAGATSSTWTKEGSIDKEWH